MKYPKEVVLKDCQEAVIRPLEKTDGSGLEIFYKEIPEAERWFMYFDVLDPSILNKWIQGIDSEAVHSIVAEACDRIVAHASLHLRGFGCARHLGRVRINVLPDFRHKRLGTWMLLDLIQLAMDKGLSDLRADFVVGVEDAAIEAAVKLDFFKRAVLEDYLKDPEGNRHSLMVMIKRLHKDWGDF